MTMNMETVEAKSVKFKNRIYGNNLNLEIDTTAIVNSSPKFVISNARATGTASPRTSPAPKYDRAESKVDTDLDLNVCVGLSLLSQKNEGTNPLLQQLQGLGLGIHSPMLGVNWVPCTYRDQIQIIPTHPRV